jgi:hypothetical protein
MSDDVQSYCLLQLLDALVVHPVLLLLWFLAASCHITATATAAAAAAATANAAEPDKSPSSCAWQVSWPACLQHSA